MIRSGDFNDDLDRRLVHLYAEAEKIVSTRLSEVMRRERMTAIDRRRFIHETELVIADLSARSDAWSRVRVPEMYVSGVLTAAYAVDDTKLASEIGRFLDAQQQRSVTERAAAAEAFVTEVVGASLVIDLHREAIAAAIETATGQFADLHAGILRDAKWQMGEAYRLDITKIIANNDELTRSMSRRKADLLKYFDRRGVAALRDRAGRSWNIKTYAEMVTRNLTTDAHIGGSVNTAAQLGITKHRVKSLEGHCTICDAHNGQTIDLKKGGEMPRYHPNCRCVLIPVVK